MGEEFLRIYNSNSWIKLEEFKRYFKKNHITHEESNFLFRKYHEDRANGVEWEDSEARTILLLAHENLILWVLTHKIKDFSEDLFQTGMIGLVSAVDTFSLEKNMEFSTYAVPCIMNKFIREHRRENTQMRDPRTDLMSFDANLTEHNDESSTLYDVCGEEDSGFKKYEEQDMFERIYCYLKPLEQYIIFSFYGKFSPPQTKIEIAKRLNLSHERARQVVDRTTEKIRILLSSYQTLTDQEKVKYNNYRQQKYQIMNFEGYNNFPQLYIAEKNEVTPKPVIVKPTKEEKIKGFQQGIIGRRVKILIEEYKGYLEKFAKILNNQEEFYERLSLLNHTEQYIILSYLDFYNDALSFDEKNEENYIMF